MSSPKAIMFGEISSTKLIMSICLVQMFLFWYCCYALHEIPAIAAVHEIVFGAIAITFMDICGDLGLLFSHPQSFIDEKSKYAVRVLAITYADQLIKSFGISLYDRFQPHVFINDYLGLSDCIEPMFAEIISWLSNIFEMFQIAKTALLAALRSLADVPSPATVDDSQNNFLLPDPTSTAIEHTSHTTLSEKQPTSTKVVEIDTANDPEPDHEPNAGESSKACQALILRSSESRSSSNASNKQTYSKGEKISREFEVNIASTPTRNVDTRVIIQEDKHGFHAIYREDIVLAPEPVVEVVVDPTTEAKLREAETKLREAQNRNEKLSHDVSLLQNNIPKGGKPRSTLYTRLDRAEKDLKDTQQSKEAIEKRLADLEGSLSNETKSKVDAEKELKAMTERKVDLEKALGQLEDELKTLKKTTEKEVTAVQKNCEVITEENDVAKQKLSKLKNDLKASIELRESTTNELKTAQDQIKDETKSKEAAMEELKTAKASLQIESESKATIKGELATVKKDLEIEKSSRQRVDKLLQSTEEQLASTQRSESLEKQSKQSLEQQLAVMTNTLAEHEKEAKSYVAAMKNIRGECNQEKQLKETAESSLQQAQQVIYNYQQNQADFDNRMQTLAQHESEIRSLTDEVVELRPLKDICSEQRNTIIKQGDQLKNMETMDSQLQNYISGYNNQQEKIRDQNEEISSLKGEALLSTQSLNTLQNTISAQNSKIQQLELDVSVIEQWKTQYFEEKKQRQFAESKLEQLLKDLHSSKTLCEKKDNEIRVKNLEIMNLKTGGENLREILKDKEAKMSKIMKQYMGLVNQASPAGGNTPTNTQQAQNLPTTVLDMKLLKDEEIRQKDEEIKLLGFKARRLEEAVKVCESITLKEAIDMVQEAEQKDPLARLRFGGKDPEKLLRELETRFDRQLKYWKDIKNEDTKQLRIDLHEMKRECQKWKNLCGGEEEQTGEKRNRKR